MQDGGDFAGRLIRDKVPDLSRADGRGAVVKVVSGQPLLDTLGRMLLEEYQNYLAAPQPEDKVTSLADMLEIILSLSHHLGTHEQELVRICLGRRTRRGGYTKGYVCEEAREA